MHANAFDPYQAGSSIFHRLDPRLKVVATVLFILSNLLLPDGAWLAFGATLVLVLLASTLSGLGVVFVIKRSFLALPFAMAAFTTLFSLPGQPLWVVDIGFTRLVVTEPGLLRFLSILARSWLSIQAAILLVATTPFPDLLHALRHLRLPEALTSIISFMYRYLFVLVDEAMRLLKAREARSAQRPGLKAGGSLAWRAGIAGNMAGQLFLRSYERSERIYGAMLARGYSGRPLTLNPHHLHSQDYWAGTLIGAALLAVQIVARL